MEEEVVAMVVEVAAGITGAVVEVAVGTVEEATVQGMAALIDQDRATEGDIPRAAEGDIKAETIQAEMDRAIEVDPREEDTEATITVHTDNAIEIPMMDGRDPISCAHAAPQKSTKSLLCEKLHLL